MMGISKFAKEQNAEYVAVADPWTKARENAAKFALERFGREPKMVGSYKDILAMEDVDAVLIASMDHQHTTHLQAAAEAKKDAYCEKPLATDFNKLKVCVEAVKKSGIVCQIGTQLRSFSSFTGCRELYKSGILGTVGRIEQCRNSTKPYWYSYMKPDVKKEDVDWKEVLMDLPDRPFDPILYSGWYGYRGFTDGPIPGLGSHFIDLVHYITGATFPTSAVAMGGVYTWKDEHKFTCPDHCEAIWEYPEGFMVHYSTNFGNGSGNTFKAFGDQGVLDMLPWTAPTYTAEGGSKNRGVIRGKNDVKPIETPDHFLDFLQCLRSRKTPNAPIDAGYQHAVAALMAVKAMDTGKRQVFDREKQEIREG
ncbi:MAG: Gfo/Idh/MocA family oxidoreductase [Verrucomicrobiota bacterium]